METTIQIILEAHDVWTQQLELDLLRHFEKLRGLLIKQVRQEEAKKHNNVMHPCNCGVGQADYFCGYCGGTLKDNNGN